MTEDIERLFRNINQADIPYQVFEPPTVPSPAIGHAEPEAILTESSNWTAEPASPPTAAKSGVFRKYLADEAEAAAGSAEGTPLQPIFDRLREKHQAAKG